MLGYVCRVGLFGSYVVMEWGPEISIIKGEKPDWLNGSVICMAFIAGSGMFSGWTEDYENEMESDPDNWKWIDEAGNPRITIIRLPADHFAYTAIDKGFTPWGVGSEAPKDWDGKAVLIESGRLCPPSYVGCWNKLAYADQNVIGYNKRERSCECFDCNVGAHAQPSPADTVTVARMTEAEATIFGRARGYGDINSGAPADCHYYGAMRDLGLIRPATKAERIAKSTNLPLADVEAVLAAVEEGE